MPKQYCFEIWRAGKRTCTYYNICSNAEQAMKWINHIAEIDNWGIKDLDWEIISSDARPFSQVYEHDSDKVGYLCEVVEELFAREYSNNCPNTEFRNLSWNDLCDGAIEILQSLKNGG
jgi:hypothetical protein